MIDVLSVRPLDPRDTDWHVFEDLLALADLPSPAPGEGCRVFAVEDEIGLLGFGGLEGAGADQMLRSIVLAPGLRHRGLAPVLVARLVDRAKAEGAARLWLLTTGADRWFRELGWTPVPRDLAPDPIRALPLYRDVGSSPATLMMRRLG